MKTKKQFKYFTIMDHKKEEIYLREMQKSGWKFVRVSGLGVYHFEECEPEDVIYQLDYKPKGKESDDEYLQMFRDCGWDYMQEYVGFRYFKKSAESMSGEENIFSDDDSRAAMMDRIYKNRLLPIFWIFFLCLIPQFVVNLSSQRYGVAVIYGVLLTLYAVVLVRCAIKYRDIKRK